VRYSRDELGEFLGMKRWVGHCRERVAGSVRGVAASFGEEVGVVT